MSRDFGFRGFFELRTPQDLLGKLRRDRERLRANPLSSDAAFDFFVTANHLVDWIWPAAERKEHRAIRQEMIPRLCEHLADGAKHFTLNRPHQGVAATERVPGARYGDNVYGQSVYGENDALVVRLEPDEAEEFGMATIIVPVFADIVLAYWDRRIGR